MDLNLTEQLNKAAGGSQTQQPRTGRVATAGTKRVNNRSITCSQELRDRLRIMAANQGVPMQTLLEEWMKEKLEAAGF